MYELARLVRPHRCWTFRRQPGRSVGCHPNISAIPERDSQKSRDVTKFSRSVTSGLIVDVMVLEVGPLAVASAQTIFYFLLPLPTRPNNDRTDGY